MKGSQMIKKNQFTRNWMYSRKSILFLVILLVFSLNNINLGIVHSPTVSSYYEETVVISWNQGVVLNTSYAFNKGVISFSFSVAVNSNSSVLFSLIPETETDYVYSWTPTLEEAFVLDPGESFFNTHTFSTSTRPLALAIWYYCTVPTVDSNATITFTTNVLNIRQALPSIGFGLVFLTSIIVATVYKYSQKKNHLKK